VSLFALADPAQPLLQSPHTKYALCRGATEKVATQIRDFESQEVATSIPLLRLPAESDANFLFAGENTLLV